MLNFVCKKSWWVALVIGLTLGWNSVGPVQAQSATPAAALTSAAATTSANATASAELISPTVTAEQPAKITDNQNNITETSGTQKDKLVAYLDAHPAQPLSWNNFLGHAIRSAIKGGVPANILVLVLLFPLIASLIAASRHIIGLRGFGIYIPAVLAVALVSTGPVVGILVFIAIISVANLSKRVFKGLNLSYLPRTALVLWMISLAILAILLLMPSFHLTDLTNLNIFPILILVLLSENFLDAQSSTKPTDALALAIETLVLAFISGFALRWEVLQHLALIQPEILIVATAIFNILVGKFAGLRLSEWLRFRPIIEE